jgi:hypothetical protein
MALAENYGLNDYPARPEDAWTDPIFQALKELLAHSWNQMREPNY